MIGTLYIIDDVKFLFEILMAMLSFFLQLRILVIYFELEGTILINIVMVTGVLVVDIGNRQIVNHGTLIQVILLGDIVPELLL